MADISKEMAPIDKHDHPENRLMMWSELELRAIEKYREAAFKLGRNAGLDAAKKIIDTIDDGEAPEYRACQEAIESLEDNTP